MSAHDSDRDCALVGRVVDDYLALQHKTASRLVENVREVLESWLATQEKLAQENELSGMCFNPLKLIPIKEPIHSKIIGDFLNPKGSHGQGSLFLDPFLKMLGVPNPSAGTWQIRIESGGVDILLWRESPAAKIIIENKVKDAQDQPNQIYRYWHWHMYHWKSDHWHDEATRGSFRLIYLPVDGSKKPAPHSMKRPMCWGDELNPHPCVRLECETLILPELLKSWREVLERVPNSNQRLRVFFHFYQELWTQL